MTHTSLDPFEDALLGELRGLVQERRTVASRMRVRAGAAVGTVLIAAVGVVVSLSSSPAFAVQQQPDGDVVVTIDRLDDSTGLERALAAHGITAHVEYHADLDRPAFDPREMPAGTPGPVAAAACSDGNVPAMRSDDHGVRITIPAATVETGEELSLFTGGASTSWAKLLVAFGDRDSGCAAFNTADAWFTWGR